MDYHFDPANIAQMRLLCRLSPAQRWRAMLEARELVVGLKRGRLRRRYPALSPVEINLKLLEELDRAQRTPRRP
jgi:hypothetical protein